MSFIHFIRLLIRNLKWLTIIPICLAASIYYFTRHEKKVYSSETVIYTGIASGSSLNTDNKSNYLTISNEFDNLLSVINSRETKQEVALKLLSEHILLKRYNPELIGSEAYKALSILIPDSLRKKLVRGTIEETKNAVTALMQTNEDNIIYKIINSYNPYYSITALQNIKASRLNSSDLIRISYETNDPGICKHTLELIIDVFMRKNRLLKEGRTESVVEYFEKQTRDAYIKLDSAEQAFLNFNKANDIINYADQTKAVAGQRENLYAIDHSLRMDEKAAENTLSKVDESIKGRIYQTLYGSDIISDREKLSDIYSKIAVNEILNKKGEGKGNQVDSLKSIASKLEGNLQTSLNKYYEKSNTPNGIPTKVILDEWLQTTLAYEQSKAKLSVMDKRKKEFAEEYKKYAPLGAMLKKIERGIGVLEREYLDYLHSLSDARLARQNNQLTSKITVVDPPFYPIAPNASKRKILVIVGFLAGLVIILSIIVVRAFLDKTLKEPSRASKIIGIPAFGVYPLLEENKDFLEKAKLRLIQNLFANINLGQKPIKLGFFSIQPGEGKTTLIEHIYHEMQHFKLKVKTVQWDNRLSHEIDNPDADVILIELTSLDNMVLIPEMLPQMHLTFLVCRANRIWNRIDKNLLSIFSKTTKTKPSFILNGVYSDYSEDYIGELPKKRMAIRSWIKRVVKFEFGNRKSFG